MRRMHPSRHFVYGLALVVVMLSQQIVSQTQSPSQPSTNPTHANGKTSAGNMTCTDSGTYVNAKGQTVPRPENCSSPPKGATAMSRWHVQFQPEP
jgi:hypothetical protein